MTIHDTLPSGFAYANESQSEEFAKTGSVHGASKVALVRTTSRDEAIRIEADYLQSVGPDEFPRGYYEVLAAEKVDDAPDADLAVRLRPPRTLVDIRSDLSLRDAASHSACATKAREWYIAEYNNGWQAAKQSFSAAWDSGLTSAPWDDGYLDQRAGRAKWHLTYCTDHDNCGEG